MITNQTDHMPKGISILICLVLYKNGDDEPNGHCSGSPFEQYFLIYFSYNIRINSLFLKSSILHLNRKILSCESIRQIPHVQICTVLCVDSNHSGDIAPLHISVFHFYTSPWHFLYSLTSSMWTELLSAQTQA